jgi:hypothetical protein
MRKAEQYCASEVCTGSEEQHNCLQKVGRAYARNAEKYLADGKPCKAYSAFQGALENASMGSEWELRVLGKSIEAMQACGVSKQDADMLVGCAERAYSLATVVDVGNVFDDEDRLAYLDAALGCATRAEHLFNVCVPACSAKRAKAVKLKGAVRMVMAGGEEEW